MLVSFHLHGHLTFLDICIKIVGMKRQTTILIATALILSGCVEEADTQSFKEDKIVVPQDSSQTAQVDQDTQPFDKQPDLTEQAEKPSPVASSAAWGQTDSPMPAGFCKIPDARPEPFRGRARGHTVDGAFYGGPSGFPLVEVTVPSVGELDWLFVMVAFEDTPRFVKTPSEFMDPHIAVLESWASFWSQGKLRFDVEYVDYWLELPMKAKDFPKDQEVYIAELLEEQLPEDIAFSDFDASFIQWDNLYEAPGATQASLAGETNYTLRIGSNELEYMDEAARPNLIWAPSFYHASNQGQPIDHKQKFAYGHWLHEILHEMGLNLHAPGNGWPTGVGQVLYPYDKSGNLWSAAISAWEQFLVTWLEDSQVHCVDRFALGGTKTVLTPLETYGGSRKMIAIPSINEEDELLVVEARSPKGWSLWSEANEGLFVYRVDPAAKHRDHVPNDCGNDPDIDKWAYYIFPDNSEANRNHCGHFSEALLKSGETLTYEGIQIKLESVVDGLFYVDVTIQDEGNKEKESKVTNHSPAITSREALSSSCGCCSCLPDLVG